jgi:hypothetical protein
MGSEGRERERRGSREQWEEGDVSRPHLEEVGEREEREKE